jgi:hypothetical protein
MKWINDLVIGRKKLGGILTEMSVDKGMVDYAVVGIGINCLQSMEDFPPEIADLATSLALSAGQQIAPAMLAAAMVEALWKMNAVLLSEKCSKVTVIQDMPVYTGEKKLQEVLFAKDNVKGITGVKVTKLIAEDGIFKGIEIEHTDSGEKEEIACDGIFVAIGRVPTSELVRGVLPLDDAGYIIAGEDTKTEIAGVFAVGDVRTKPLRQIVTATADGAVAAEGVIRYLDGK